MTLKRTPLLFVFLLSVTFIFATPTREVSFINNNLEVAKTKAAAEGKLIMVDFWASWCSPCRWMDEQTFSKDNVASYLNENYVSVRVDIDNFDGIGYKKQYGIRFLPTILILDENGSVIKKYEESLAPSKLIKVLKEHDDNKIAPRKHHMVKNMSRASVANTPVKTAPKKKWKPATTGLSQQQLAANAYTQNSRTTNTISNPVFKPSKPSSTANNPNRGTYTPSEYEAAEDRGLWVWNVKEAPKVGYSVQVGLYYDQKNAMAEVHKFQKQFAEEVLVHIADYKGQTCYKVMLGHYTDQREAAKDKAILREAGLKDAFVKELSTL